MLDPIFQFFERLVTQFSWGRLLLLITTLCIALAVLAWYESYTGQFRLGRIERAITLLEKITDLSPKIKSASDEGLTKIHKALVDDLVDYVSGNANPFSLSLTTLKVLAALFPWVLLGTAMAFASDAGGTQSALIGMTAAAVPFLVLAAYLPDFEQRWINFVLYPFGSMLVTVMGITIWSNRKKKKV